MGEIIFVNKTNNSMFKWEKMYMELFNVSCNILKIQNQNIVLSLTWVSKDEALELNQEYRGQNYVPDVISFPLDEDEAIYQLLGERELGDIFICYDVAIEKANFYHHEIKTEMGFLFVHGFLHLLGYDHELNLEDEKKMFALQDQILKAYGITYEVIYDNQNYLEKE